MRHGYNFRILHRTPKQRHNLFRTMLSNLILHQRINTTLQKATELQKHMHHLINVAKKNRIDRIHRYITHWPAINTLRTDILPLFKDWTRGDYTKIIPTGIRKNDKGQSAIIEFNGCKKQLDYMSSPEHLAKTTRRNENYSFGIKILKEEQEFLKKKKEEYKTLLSLNSKDQSHLKIDYKHCIERIDKLIQESNVEIESYEIRHQGKSVKIKFRELNQKYYQ